MLAPFCCCKRKRNHTPEWGSSADDRLAATIVKGRTKSIWGKPFQADPMATVANRQLLGPRGFDFVNILC